MLLPGQPTQEINSAGPNYEILADQVYTHENQKEIERVWGLIINYRINEMK